MNEQAQDFQNQGTQDAPITDEQVDKFFESGGEDAGLGSEGEAPSGESEAKTAETPSGEAQEGGSDTGTAEEKKVPLGALHEERGRRKALETRLQQMEQMFSKVMDKIQPDAGEEPQKEARPSYEEDPVGYREWMERKISDYDQALQRQQQISELQNQQAHLRNAVLDAEQKFAKEQGIDDYPQALQHVVQKRAREYELLGYSPAQIDAQIRTEITEFAANQLNQGLNPAEAIYRFAKETGYSPSNPGGASQAPKTPADHLKKVAEGQKASKTLAGGGEPESSNLTLEKLSRMSDEEFDKYWDEMVKG